MAAAALDLAGRTAIVTGATRGTDGGTSITDGS
jgi:hypothetical protein